MTNKLELETIPKGWSSKAWIDYLKINVESEESLRRTGRTTRLVDYFIQELYRNGTVTPKDHIDIAKTNKDLTERIFQRLMRESSRNLKIKRVGKGTLVLLREGESIAKYTRMECISKPHYVEYVAMNEDIKTAMKEYELENGPYEVKFDKGDIINKLGVRTRV